MLLDIKPILCGDTNIIIFDYLLSIDDDDDFKFDDVSFSMPFRVSGNITNSAGYMSLTLEANIIYDTYCARCMKPIQSIMCVNIIKTIAVNDTLENEDNDDYLLVCDGSLDVDTSLKEQILLNFPIKSLCTENCKGLCPKCGKDLNEGICGCPTKEIDPRLEVLKKLLEK